MMYMPDGLRVALNLMATDAEAISVRTSYKVGG